MVERRIEVAVEKYVEVPRVTETNKVINVENRIQKAVNVQKT